MSAEPVAAADPLADRVVDRVANPLSTPVAAPITTPVAGPADKPAAGAPDDLATLLARVEARQAESPLLGGGVAGAITLYRDWLGRHANEPLAHVAWFNLGVALASLPDPVAAEAAYRCAIALQPGFAEAHLNLGSQLERQGRTDDAIASWRAVLDARLVDPLARPGLHCHLLNNLGRALENGRDYEAAEAMLERSLRCQPDQPGVLQHWVHLRQRQCRWPVYQPFGEVTLAAMVRATSPLAMLAAHDDPALQLWRAGVFLQDKHPASLSTTGKRAITGSAGASVSAPPAVSADPALPPARRERLRIGYLSSDLCQHAVSMLMVELLERHDRERVDMIAFSWSRDDGSAIRERVRRAVSHYVPIGALTDEQAVDLIRAHDIDVLIDLQGLTSGARPGILACRPAPLQLTWLGFPGTTGMPFIDYVIADRFVLPEALTPFFIEKPLYLPHCFQPSDSTRVVGPAPDREACGLPPEGFVYCSFNNNYKFDPKVFGAWMTILAAVPGSVLWLLADNRWAESNLRREAERLGIDPTRLVFAPRVDPDQYLARYRAADLFLDTRPFNAGTTASDALWAGLALLTCPGRTFASRMAGSLLNALGLPELIAEDLDDYVRRAIALGNDPQGYATLRERLVRARTSSPVFDIAGLARALEDQLLTLSHGRR